MSSAHKNSGHALKALKNFKKGSSSKEAASAPAGPLPQLPESKSSAHPNENPLKGLLNAIKAAQVAALSRQVAVASSGGVS